MTNSVLAIVNGSLVLPARIMPGGAVVVDGNRIAWLGPAAALPPLPPGRRIMDASGMYVCPGFVDIHVHGGGGADTMDNTPEAFAQIARCHAAGGTTAFVATTVTASIDQLLNVMRTAADMAGTPTGGASLVGVHLEGPFLAPTQIGAHNPVFRQDPADCAYERLLSAGAGVRRITVAPELPGADVLIRKAVRQGWHVAMGHSTATGSAVAAAVAAGCRHVTHLFSCSSSLRNTNGYKEAGINESALLFAELTVELIADGHHLSGELAAAVARCKGVERACLVTDAMRAAGMPPGRYDLGGLDVLVEDGVAKLPDRSRFAGSVATMAQLVREVVQSGGLGLADAVRLASTTPARLIGLGERKGILATGADADLVLLSADLNVQCTVVNGQVVFEQKIK